MKATYAAFTYGGPDYPVAEANLPDLDLEPVIKQALQAMSRLSGGFGLKQPDHVSLEIVGDGYVVRVQS